MGKLIPLLKNDFSSSEDSEKHSRTLSGESEINLLLNTDPLTDDQLVQALNGLLTTSMEESEIPPEALKKVLKLFDHRNPKIHALAHKNIVRFAKAMAPFAESDMRHWKDRVQELLELDNRTNRFANLYLRTVDSCECLSVLSRWTDNRDELCLVRFFVELETESEFRSGGRQQFADIASQYLDHFDEKLILEKFPDALSYLLGQLEGECFPSLQKPSRKTFARLCAFKQHDKICQILQTALTLGDLEKIHWFSRNLYPLHFAEYHEYELELIEVIGCQLRSLGERENAVTAMLFINEDILLKRQHFKDFVSAVLDSFDREQIASLVSPQTHPKVSKIFAHA